MSMDLPLVESCTTVEEFLAFLSPQNSRWGDEPSKWIFRGQADSRWLLVPKILRRRATGELEWEYLERKTRVRRRILDTLEPHGKGNDRLSVEWALVDEFLRAADLAGLHIPEDTQLRRNVTLVHQEMLNSVSDRKGTWPPFSWLSAVALAQHYGVATRLLDWTWKPRIAAYFAAVDVASSRVESGELAVWALDSRTLHLGTSLLQYHQRPALVTAPYNGNPNLAAQCGVFTVDYDARDPGRPFEAFLGDHLELALGNRDMWTPEHLGTYGVTLPPLQKVILPSERSGELLRRLAEEHVTAATIYPGYRGVTESLAEQLLWDRRPWDVT